MLVIASARQIQNGFGVAQPIGALEIVSKANNLIGVGNVNVLAVEGDSKGQI